MRPPRLGKNELTFVFMLNLMLRLLNVQEPMELILISPRYRMAMSIIIITTCQVSWI